MNVKLVLKVMAVNMRIYDGRWNITVAGGLCVIITMETVLFLTVRKVPNRNRNRDSNNNRETTNQGA